MAVKMTVTYTDGRQETVLVSPRAQVMTERQFGGLSEARQVESGYYMAWLSLSQAGKEPAEFEAWLDLVEDVAPVEGADPRPTHAAPSAALSSD